MFTYMLIFNKVTNTNMFGHFYFDKVYLALDPPILASDKPMSAFCLTLFRPDPAGGDYSAQTVLRL